MQQSGELRWVHMSTARSQQGRSSRRGGAYCSECAAGSTTSSQCCRGPPHPTSPAKAHRLWYKSSSVQSRSRVRLFATPQTAARQASLSITNPQSLLKLMSIELVMPSNHLILCHPLLLPPSIFPSIRVFSNESALRMRWPKLRCFSFSISPSNEHSGLISFRMDWLDFLAVQRTLKSLLQHCGSKASILRCSAFLTVQLSHPYTTTGKTIALTRRTFVGKVMSKWGYIIHPLVYTTVPPNTQVLGVPPMQACPPWCQLAQVCLKPSVGCEEHTGHHHGALRVLDSSLVGKDST